MSTVCIVHFQPVERYPPAGNLLEVLASREMNAVKYVVITTETMQLSHRLEVAGISVIRVARLKKGMSRWRRIATYFQFSVKAFFILVKCRPETVLYYETLSAAAPIWYKNFIKPSLRLFIHYHEYTSLEEYATGMVLSRWLHKAELKIYKRAYWVSHTNDERMHLFLRDCGRFAPTATHILPNYPPSAWLRQSQLVPKTDIKEKIGIVYVGALDTTNMYLAEMAAYVMANADICYWDIYSDNVSVEANIYLNGLSASNISFRGGIRYHELPDVLSQYSLGVILYRGHIPNYVYNAPNKLFEYLICGLDVWFPRVMAGCMPYVTTNSFPIVRALDFENLEQYDIRQLTDHSFLQPGARTYSCEQAFTELIDNLTKA